MKKCEEVLRPKKTRTSAVDCEEVLRIQELPVPTSVTLKKYGMTAGDYVAMFRGQDGQCDLCGEPLDGKRVNIDHFHVRGWKKMKPEKRRIYVRALLHARCNRFLLGPTFYGFTAVHFRWAADYLDKHDRRFAPGV